MTWLDSVRAALNPRISPTAPQEYSVWSRLTNTAKRALVGIGSTPEKDLITKVHQYGF